MCNWKSWLIPGVVAVAVLTAIAAAMRGSLVESELVAKTQASLQDQHGWAQIAASGRDIVLNGTAPTPEAIDQAAELARSVPGTRIVAIAAEPLPLQDPFSLSAILEDGTVTLEGFAPDAAAAEAIGAAIQAALPDASIDNKLQPARGAPEGFVGLIAYTTAQLATLSQGRIEVVGTEISVSGEAISPAGYENALAALSSGLAGATVKTLEIEPAAISPFAWSFHRGADSFTVDGFAPNAADRDAVFAAARDGFPGLRLDGDLSVAAGLGSGIDWQDASRFMLSQLSGLSSGGTVSVSDGVLDIDGRAADPNAFTRISAALAGVIPAGLQLGTADIRQPIIDPFEWSLAVDDNGNATIGGYAPDRETAQRLAATVRDALPGDGELIDEQQIGAGAPDDFESVVNGALSAALRLSGGHVVVSGRKVAVSGEGLSGATLNDIRRQLAGAMPSDVDLDAKFTVKPVGERIANPECQERLNSALSRASVRFDTGSATIAPSSFGLLDRIAFVMRHCPQARVEIGGHTDAQGSDADNLTLSGQRAQSVAAYLERAGILGGRLTAKGYGETVPVADNSTQDGRQRNRRIELRILP